MIKPFPKPSISPRPKLRLPVRKCMTAILGFNCSDGVLMMAIQRNLLRYTRNQKPTSWRDLSVRTERSLQVDRETLTSLIALLKNFLSSFVEPLHQA